MSIFQQGDSRDPQISFDCRAAGCAILMDRAAASDWKDAARSGTTAT
jgi:hypothetical protein